MVQASVVTKIGGYGFRIFKYGIYGLLAFNIFLFFRQDLDASSQIFGDGVNWLNVVEAFSATFDTLAWVILLLLFELETAVISDEKLRGGLKWFLTGVRSICYGFIVYAFYGYISKYGVITRLSEVTDANACLLALQGFSYIDSLDDYLPLTSGNCMEMMGQPLFQILDTQIVGTEAQTALIHQLATVDIINAGDWLLVVVFLEVEVFLQLRGKLTLPLLRISKATKVLLYSVLLGCAIFWGIRGDFLDFWDAFLWLLAFAFIELNIFEWNAETRNKQIVSA